jgi:hypothetical protein
VADGKTLWVVLTANASQYRAAMKDAGRDTDAFGNKVDDMGRRLNRSGFEVDRMSGRIRLIVDALTLVGPALVPIGAVAVPAIAGLAAQLGFAALAGGSFLAMWQGVGGALEAVNKAALEPTADNLEAARIAMEGLGPEAQDMVRQLQGLRPVLKDMRDAAAAQGLPGVSALLEDFEEAAPDIERMLAFLADASGDVAAELGEGLSGPRMAEFMQFVGDEGPTSIKLLADTVFNLAAGMGELWMAFTPSNTDFAVWLRDNAREFDEWAQRLDETQGFEDFIAYIQTNGPRVAEALGAIGSMLLHILEAAAPLGGPTLMALEAVADVIGTIADSDAGPAIMATVTALTLLSRTTKVLESTRTSQWFTRTTGSIGGMVTALGSVTSAQERATMTATQLADKEKEKQRAIRSGLGTMGRGAAMAGGLAFAYSGAADKIGLTNTVSLAMMGMIAGPWGAAVGGAIGLIMDFASGNGNAAEEIQNVAQTLDQQTGAITDNTREWAARKLIDEGVAADAEKLGISMADLTSAALGEADAVARVNAVMEEHANTQDRMIVGRGGAIQGMSQEALAASDLGGAIDNVNGILGEAQEETRLVAAATGGLTYEWERTNSAAQEFKSTLIEVNELLSDRADMRSYEQSLDDFATTLNDVKNKARLLNKDGTINIGLQGGREVQAALDNIAGSALAVAENMRGTQRIQFLTQARQDFIDAAVKLGFTRQQARGLADDFGLLDRKRARPKIEVQAGSAASILDNINRGLDRADRDVTASVTVNYSTTGRDVKPGGDFEPGLADGGTVPGQRWPYGDKTIIAAAPGEEVISNRYGDADRFRADRAAGRIPRYANGGTVGSLVAPPAAPTVVVRGGLPDKLTLVVDGHRFTAYVRGQAAAVVSRRDQTQHNADRTADNMGGPR